MNEILQWGAVAVIVVIAAVWGIRRFRRKPVEGCNDGCGDCPLVNNCATKSKKR